MPFSAVVRDELGGVHVVDRSARGAQVATILRLAATVHLVAGQSVLDVDIDRISVAQRLREDIRSLHNLDPQILELRRDTTKQDGRYIVRVREHATMLARQTGLVDRRGCAVRGLPASVVGGSVSDAVAVWRGALMAKGTFTDPRRCSVCIECPTLEATMALTGAARRLGIEARSRHVDGHQAVIRDGDTISALLGRVGATAARAQFDKEYAQGRTFHSDAQFANFDTANQQRTELAATTAIARVTRAFDILGDDVPDHLAQFGRLRIAHPSASLDELGRLADPPVTKDAAAGRLRRLLATADAHAHLNGTADTRLSPSESFW